MKTDKKHELMAEVERLTQSVTGDGGWQTMCEVRQKDIERLCKERDDLKVELAAAQADVKRMQEFITDISKQKPEKPDYWSSCGQCEHNISQAEDILEAMQGETDDMKMYPRSMMRSDFN